MILKNKSKSGVLKKKFEVLRQELDDQEEEMAGLHETQESLRLQI